MADVSIRPAQVDDVHHIVEISHLISPEYPRLTVEEYIGRVGSVPSDVPFIRFVADQDGSVVGFGDVLSLTTLPKVTAGGSDLGPS